VWWFWETLSRNGVALPTVVEPSMAPFVGRDAEIAALGLAIDQLKSGIGGTITLEGARGSGKHRLVDEAQSATKGAGVDWEATTIFALDDVVRTQRLGFGAQSPRVVAIEHGELVSPRDTVVLHDLIGNAQASQTLLILTIETGLESRVRQRRLGALVQRAVVRLPLQPLSGDEMSAVFKHICGNDFVSIPTDIAAACIELAGGNPGYLLDIVASLGNEKPSFPTAAGEVVSRSRNLNRFEVRALRAASVAGNFTMRQLSVMLKATQSQTAETLQLLCDRGILACRDAGLGSSAYRFSHPLWRLVVYYDATNDMRTLLHGAALRYLSKSAEKRPAAMAEHLGHAGKSTRAVREAIAATDIALRDRSYVEAAQWSRYVLRFARDIDLRLVARERLAVSLEMLGASESAVLEYTSGLHDAQRNEMPGKVVQFAEGLAVTQFYRGRPAEALDSLARVLANEQCSVLAQPRLLALAAYFSAVSASKPGPWLSLFERSDVEEITEVDLLRVHASRAFAFLHCGDVANAVHEAEAGLALARGTDDFMARVKGYELAGEVAAALGDMNRAVSYARTTFAVIADSPVEGSTAKAPRMDYLRQGAASNLAQYLALSGNISEALELCARFSQTPCRAGDLTWVMLRVSDTFSRVLAGGQNPTIFESSCSATDLLDVAIESEQKTSISFAASALALHLYRSGEQGEARDVVHRGLAALTDCTDAWLLLTTAAQIARPADFRRVRQIASAGPLAQIPFYSAVRSLTEALYGKRQHRASRRISSEVAEARSVFDRLGNKYLMTLCDACSNRSTGREALKFAHPLGSTRSHVSRPLLSEQQGRIAELVALGWSDRRVSEALGIAEGTVGVHLARIYRKLDVTSRGELRSRWHEAKVPSASK
jgi:DNA-binding CsgD family transcriptional regulator/tetratricopeptide (TPR) repeat protein